MPGDTARTIVEFITTHTANDIPADRAPIVIPANMNLADALKFLADSWIRACPVQSEDKKSFEGTLDLREACPFLLDMYKERKSTSKSASGSFKREPSATDIPQIKTLVEYIRAHGSKSAVTDLSRKRAFHVLRPTATLLEIAKALSSGSHIVGVTGGPESTCGLSKVITQVQQWPDDFQCNFGCLSPCFDSPRDRGLFSSSWPHICKARRWKSTRSSSIAHLVLGKSWRSDVPFGPASLLRAACPSCRRHDMLRSGLRR